MVRRKKCKATGLVEMENLFDQTNFPCDISMTAPSYMNDLKSFYMKDVIVPKCSSEDMIADLQKHFILERVELSKSDELTYSTLKSFFLGIIDAEPTIIWKLHREDSTEIFYKAYYKNYYEGSSIYLVFGKNSKKFFSNCSLYQCYIAICQGIDQMDILNDTGAFKSYLNTMYLYHQSLYELSQKKTSSAMEITGWV